MKIFTLASLIILFTGCSFLNTFYNEEEVFTNERYSEIGETLKSVLKSEHYFLYAYPKSKGFKELNITSKNGNITEYTFEGRGSCKWKLVVDSKTNIILNWSYFSHKYDCRYKKFYERSMVIFFSYNFFSSYKSKISNIKSTLVKAFRQTLESLPTPIHGG